MVVFLLEGASWDRRSGDISMLLEWPRGEWAHVVYPIIGGSVWPSATLRIRMCVETLLEWLRIRDILERRRIPHVSKKAALVVLVSPRKTVSIMLATVHWIKDVVLTSWSSPMSQSSVGSLSWSRYDDSNATAAMASLAVVNSNSGSQGLPHPLRTAAGGYQYLLSSPAGDAWGSIAYNVTGNVMFLAWSVSFYPQLFLNFRRGSTLGMSVAFQWYNLVGFGLYAVYTFYQAQSSLQDVLFGVHAFIVTLVTLFQVWWYERTAARATSTIEIGGIGRTPRRSTGRPRLLSIFCSFPKVHAFCLVLLITALALASLFCLAGVPWLEFAQLLYVFGFTKTVVSVLKYTPQVYLNFQRKSTRGFSMGNVYLDLTGGINNIGQQVGGEDRIGGPGQEEGWVDEHFIAREGGFSFSASKNVWRRYKSDIMFPVSTSLIVLPPQLVMCYWDKDSGTLRPRFTWDPFTQNLPKFLISCASLVYDSIYLYQHFVLYRQGQERQSGLPLEAPHESRHGLSLEEDCDAPYLGRRDREVPPGAAANEGHGSVAKHAQASSADRMSRPEAAQELLERGQEQGVVPFENVTEGVNSASKEMLGENPPVEVVLDQHLPQR